MSDIDERIERFRNMAQADPQNELGHFSLARALMDAGRHGEAVPALRRVIEIDRTRSKAYQMLGESLVKAGQPREAVAVLTEGVKTADARGEMLPRNEMVELLKHLGAAVPELKAAVGPAVAVGEGQVMCKRCGQLKPKLPGPPFKKGELGKLVYENVCAQCWDEAIRMGTKVINEMRLDLSDPRAQKVWETNIREFLNLG